MNKISRIFAGGQGSNEGVIPAGEKMAEVGKTDFEFYAKFAKPLILTLNCTEDRILAASWFSKLRDEASGPDSLRLDYLKLLLFVLQRHRLVGPFVDDPNAKEKLDEFGENYELAAVARQIVEKEQKERKEHYLKKMRGEVGDWPPFSTDYSSDLREYVAAQDIPNFGVHVYYAISKDPILDWDNPHHAVFPRAIRRMEPHGHISETSFAVMEPRPETPEETEKCQILAETGVMPDESIFTGGRKKRDRKSPYANIDRPAPPLGILPGEEEGGFVEEELPPPTWGSNLIEVREPIDMEGVETTEDEVSPGPSVLDVPGAASETTTSPELELEAEDPEILRLLETSFNMEDILAEVDAMETEEPAEGQGGVDPLILEEEQKFKEMEADLDRHDAAIAEALASLDEDERRMLMEMEAEEAAGLPPKSKPSPGREVKVVADEDTVIKLLVESPGAISDSNEEKARKETKAAMDKKQKPAGRTGLDKGKARGAILKKGEKKELEDQEKNAKVVDTNSGIPEGISKRTGIPKTKSSKVKIAVSEGDIPSEKPSSTERGKEIPGKGIPRKGGLPRRVAAKQPPGEGMVEMVEMKDRIERKLNETKDAYPEKFEDEQTGATGISEMTPEEEELPRGRTPLDDIVTLRDPGSPESDDIYEDMAKENEILERLHALYEQLAPNQPEGLRTPPIFSRHREIRELGRQLRYRADEFGIHPMEKFEQGPEFFAGREAPSPFVDPRLVDRRTAPFDTSEEATPEQTPPVIQPESPPWSKIEELKRIMESADRSLDASPAISAKVGMTTPKTPATPRRPIRAGRKSEFDMESPPPYESPPPSPLEMPTPEFLRDPGWGLPKVLTRQMVEEMYREKQAEHEAYIQAEMEDELSKWPILAPKAPSPPPDTSPRVPDAAPSPLPSSPLPPSRTPPEQRILPHAPTPPSVGAPGAPPISPGTPQGLPPSRRYQYETPPRLRPAPIEIPGAPEIEEFDPMQHEDILYQAMPDLVEADFDDFETTMASPKFKLMDWYDPMKAILEQAAEEEDGMMDFDMAEELTDMDIDLQPFEEDYRQFSPVITLQDRLMQHEIPKEFLDPARPKARSTTVRVGDRKIRIPRTTKPTQLAQEIIEEDEIGENFDQNLKEYEDMIKEEELEFLNRSLGDPDRVEYMKKMADEAQEVQPFLDETPPELFDMDESLTYGFPTPPPKTPEMTPQRSPERPKKPPSPPWPPAGFTPVAPERVDPQYARTTPEYHPDMFQDEEPDFLASPGMPSPEPPPTPEPGPPTPPWAPPPEAYYIDNMFDEEEEDIFLASPGLPPGRTLEDDLREIGGPIRLPRSPEIADVPVNLPIGPPGRPVGPGEMRIEPGYGAPSPRRARMVSPMGTPELDPIALRRQLIGHRVDFAKRDEFAAGEERVKRRTPIPRRFFPLMEHAGYEESKKYYKEAPDYREMMSRLPPAPPQAAYPEDLMGQEYEGRFPYQETLLDQPLPPIENLPSPLRPQRQLMGWSTPPHQKIGPLPQVPFFSPTPPRQPDIFMKLAPHVRGRLRPEERGEGIFDIREEDVFPEELMYDSYGSPGASPRVPASIMSPGMAQHTQTVAIPTMTMDQQISLAEDRAAWQAQQIASQGRSPPRPSPRAPPRDISPPQSQLSPGGPQPKMPPCSRPSEPSPKVLKRVQEASYTSGVYDPESPENSRKWKRGRTILEFNRPEEGGERSPVVTPPSQGVAVYPRGPPASAPTSPSPMPMSMPMPIRRPMAIPQRRQIPPRRVVRPIQAGGTPRMEGGRLPRRNILAGEGGMPLRRRLFEQSDLQETAEQPAPPSPPRRICPGVTQGEKVEIVEEYEENEADYIPEHLRDYKWMDVEEEDQFYSAFRQQFQ